MTDTATATDTDEVTDNSGLVRYDATDTDDAPDPDDATDTDEATDTDNQAEAVLAVDSSLAQYPVKKPPQLFRSDLLVTYCTHAHVSISYRRSGLS